MREESFTIRPDEAGQRIDSLLAKRFPETSRSYFQYLIESGFVQSDGEPLKKKEKLPDGTFVNVIFAPDEPLHLEPEKVDFEVLYEDEVMIAINKPQGVVVHPGAGNRTGTLVAGVLHYLGSLPDTDDPLRPGIVHRLDKETSGVMIVAKTRGAHAFFVEGFKMRKIKKTYIAITHSKPNQLKIDAPIGRHPIKREMMAIRAEGGKEAVTELSVLGYDHAHAYLLVKPITGRTHQIRVHLKSIGTPIVGDEIYGKGNEKGTPLCLHAYEISFIHPITNALITLQAPPPEHIVNWSKRLIKNSR